MATIEKFTCRPQFYADPGLKDVKSDPHVAIPFHVVLTGASPGAYTSRELVQAESQGEPFFCCEVVSWHEVKQLWARNCLFHHRHSDDHSMQTLRWMKVTMRRPLLPPPHPPSTFPHESLPGPASAPRDDSEGGDSPRSSFAASEIASNAPSFEAISFTTWRSALPTPSPPSSDPGDVRFEDFSSAVAAAAFVLDEPVAPEPPAVVTDAGPNAEAPPTIWYEVSTHTSFRSWPDVVAYLSKLDAPVGEMNIRCCTK